MFDDNQIKSLENELDNNRVKTRSKGNVNLSYLEGFDVIETANTVFGFGNWSYSITLLEQVSQETNQNQNHVVCYKAIVSVTIHDNQHSKQIQREDVGLGTGIAKSLNDAHEGSCKEAVTDALKRALRGFGNQFGLSLYDKSKNHSNNNTSNNQYTQTSQSSSNYISLTNLGLEVIDNGNGCLVVRGDDIFSKKASIKNHGFKWDGTNKVWWKPIEQGAA